jgi:hypothetical protein
VPVLLEHLLNYRPGTHTGMTKQPFIAEAEREDGFTHILLITTGSVASVKAPLIVSELLLVRIFFVPSYATVNGKIPFSTIK